MAPFQRTAVIAGLLLLLVFTVSCRMGRSNYMSDEQRKRMASAYEAVQSDYQSLKEDYQAHPDSLSPELQSLYARMQQMHSTMDVNHRQMMGGAMGGGMQNGHGMMGDMGMRLQGHRTGEWYKQMRAMHEKMAGLHQQRGQQRMARMNRRLSEDYGRMSRLLPGRGEPAEVPFNEQGNPDLLNGERLFAANCASCHGSDAEGMPGVFPPLKHSEWVTGAASIPIRILLNGLEGEVTVREQTYDGIMPSFRARLSAAEIAAILNYLREQSEDDLPRVTQQQVIGVGEQYRNRTASWTAAELKDSGQ